ncbi:MAG: hypothetical protein IKV77_00265 [Alistipes sp.]|nr:hypothetical protein [Alistipes sp.]
MKNLNKFAAQQLSKNQMNDVRGGAYASCPNGQQAFYCVLTLDGLGADTTGIVCGTSVADAERQANALLAEVMEITDDDRYVCHR